MKQILISLLFFVAVVPASAWAGVMASATADTTGVYNAFEVSYDDVEDAVANALNQKGIDDKLSVTVAGRKNGALFAYNTPVSVEIKGLEIEQPGHRWTASLLFVSNGEVVSAMPATGHFEALIELPVLKREVRAGDVISDADIEIRDFSARHARTDTVTDISALIGKTPLHNISPSRPIREQEVSNPAVVKKNTMVEMLYTSPGMEISATGEALSDGAKGDVINVRNTSSKKVVHAVIVDSRTVNIISLDRETSQLTGNDHGAN